MSDAVIFQMMNAAVMPGWALLLVDPRWRWTAPLISGCLLPLLVGVTYLILLATGPRIEGGGFFTLEQVHTLFRHPHAILVGWAHYLAFDLFVGGRQVRSCWVALLDRHGSAPTEGALPPWWYSLARAPCLRCNPSELTHARGAPCPKRPLMPRSKALPTP